MSKNIILTIVIFISFSVLSGCSKYSEPKVSEIHIATKGAPLGETGGGVLPKSYISPKPYNLAGFTENLKIEKVYYTPMTLSKVLPITMERDDNAQVTFRTDGLVSLNGEKAHDTVVKFKNYKYEMERILGKVMQYKLSKKSFGFKAAVSSDKELTIEELEKLNEFSDRVRISDDLRVAFVLEFNKSFPKFPLVDMQVLPDNKEKRIDLLKNASFYFNGLALTSIDIDDNLIKPFEKIAVSQYRTKKAQVTKDIKNTKGKIRVQDSLNLVAGIKQEAKSVTNEVMSHLSREVVLGAVENKDIDVSLFIEINPDMSINFDDK